MSNRSMLQTERWSMHQTGRPKNGRSRGQKADGLLNKNSTAQRIKSFDSKLDGFIECCLIKVAVERVKTGRSCGMNVRLTQEVDSRLTQEFMKNSTNHQEPWIGPYIPGFRSFSRSSFPIGF